MDWKRLTEDSDKDKQLTSHVSSDEEDYRSRDPLMPFVDEDFQQGRFFPDSISDHFFTRATQILLEYQLEQWVPHLWEPTDLFGGLLGVTRWPYHCDVIEEKVSHIDWTPPQPEPTYIQTGLEKEPLYSDTKEKTVVYLADDANKESCFVYSQIGGRRNPLKKSVLPPLDNWDNTLVFEARFESGNLQKVVKVGEYEYQLTMRSDLFTNRHTQWYYFQVTNTQAGTPYRFTIVNFAKPASLYGRGMRPLFYSEKEAEAHHIGWKRTGDQIKYYRNNLGQDGRRFFSLTWTFQFPHSKDTCYFAHCYPYTYANLQDYLAVICNDPVKSKFCKVGVLCHSLARNMVYVLTITTPSRDSGPRKRKAVILTARVHPGESNSSWIMKGFLDYILGESSDAQLLRDTFVFKVIPMLNPDGVIVGNYRCSLTGRDLNRNYKSILKELFPSIWHTRNMIRRVMAEREVLLYCDFHGHSRKENIFMYGCEGNRRARGFGLQPRIFPLMMSKNCPDKFSFQSCQFKVQKSKEGTGRVVMWKMGIRNSFTLEATFCGSTLGNRQGTHFNTKDLESMGYHFCDALLDYCDPDQSKYFQCLKELEELEKQHPGMDSEKLNYNSDGSLPDVTLDLESSNRGSESSESRGTPAYLLELASQIKTKEKHLKTKKERNARIINQKTSKEISQQKEFEDTGAQQQRLNEKKHTVKDSGTLPGTSRLCQLGRPFRTTNLYESFGVTPLRAPLRRKTSSCSEKTVICPGPKPKMREHSSFPRRSGKPWSNEEEELLRGEEMVQTQGPLRFLLPSMQNPQTRRCSRIKPSAETHLDLQDRPDPVTFLNMRSPTTSLTPHRKSAFFSQRNILAKLPQWTQPVSPADEWKKSGRSLMNFKGLEAGQKNSVVWPSSPEPERPPNSNMKIFVSDLKLDKGTLKDQSLKTKTSNPKFSSTGDPQSLEKKDSGKPPPI
ncbi:cytosolic carboxypeptidase 3 isoform X2 [Ornithorhynchus anatinus]|nr:cytosolic carboxypeptidase 3 isoform X2 [Ornithorhynchus anatinus]